MLRAAPTQVLFEAEMLELPPELTRCILFSFCYFLEGDLKPCAMAARLAYLLFPHQIDTNPIIFILSGVEEERPIRVGRDTHRRPYRYHNPGPRRCPDPRMNSVSFLKGPTLPRGGNVTIRTSLSPPRFLNICLGSRFEIGIPVADVNIQKPVVVYVSELGS